MGFGYLFLGYLIAFLLMPVADGLGVAFVALLLGYTTMLYALHILKHFCYAFAYAQWSLYPLVLLSFYHALENLSELFLWNVSFVTPTVTSIIGYVEFGFVLLFHAALLSAVRVIGNEVGLKSTAAAAIRNFIIMMLYAAVAIVYFIPIAAFEGIRSYLGLSVTLMKLVYVICNLLLLVSCAKNICAEGEDEPEPKRYRWEFLNKVGDSFASTFQKASDRNRSDMEAYLRKKKTKRERKEALAEQRNKARRRQNQKKK